MVVLLLAFAPEHRAVNYSIPEFRMAQPDQLYFKNIREYYYTKEVDEKSGYEILRLQSLWKDTAQTPAITFALIKNWRVDQAYVVAERRGELVFEKPISLTWKNKKEEGEINLDAFNNEAQFQFAGEVYTHLINGDELLFEGEPLYTERKRKSIIKTLKDYFRLVGKIY